jgi:hypothetical protein
VIDVPEVFARSTVAREGEAGTAWLAGLPALVAELLARWECEPTANRWLAVDPKGYAGDPAYDAGVLLKTRALTILTTADPAAGLRRSLDIFAESAELDRERVARWAQLHAVQSAFWGRRHGFRRGRTGAERDRLIALVDGLVELLPQY